MTVAWELATVRMKLMRISQDHLDDLVRLDSDPEVMRFISRGEPTARQAYIDDLLPRMMDFENCPYGFAAERVGSFMHPRVPLVVVRYLVRRPDRPSPAGVAQG